MNNQEATLALTTLVVEATLDLKNVTQFILLHHTGFDKVIELLQEDVLSIGCHCRG